MSQSEGAEPFAFLVGAIMSFILAMFLFWPKDPQVFRDEVANAVCIERGFTDGRWDGQKVVCRQITYGEAK